MKKIEQFFVLWLLSALTILSNFSEATSFAVPATEVGAVNNAKIIVQGHFGTKMTRISRESTSNDKNGTEFVFQQLHGLRDFYIDRVIVGEGILTNNQIQIDYVDGDVALLEKFQSLGSNQSVVLALDTTRYGKGDQHPYHIRNSRIFDKSAILQKPDETLENWINRVRNVSAAEYQKMLRDELAAKGETEWAARLEPRTFPPQRIQTGMLKSQPLQDNEVDKLQGELLPKSVSSSSITTTEASVQPQQNISSKSIEIGQQEKRSWSTSLLGVVLLVALITVVWRWKK